MPHLPGPRGPVRFTRDAWGYPTIHARDTLEGAFAVGWMHATDRLVSMELVRMVGEGRLMSLVGDEPFARRVDRATRSLAFSRGLEEALAALDDDHRAWLEAYAKGVHLGAVQRGFPWVLRAAGLTPRRWTAIDVLRAMRVVGWFGLTSTTQVAKAAIAELLCDGADPEGLSAVLGCAPSDLDAEAARTVDWDAEESLVGMPGLGGSNAFALHGSRTRSGGAIVLSEFHMEIGRIPPGLYMVDLRHDDGTGVCGLTAPGMPHFLAGRNDRCAWTYTFGHLDNVDVTVETVKDGAVKVGRSWKPLSRRTETVAMQGGRVETWVFRDSPVGGIVFGEGDGQHAGMRWRGFEDVGVDSAVLFHAAQACSVDELVAIHRTTSWLGTNAVFGDAEGHVAWMLSGKVAKRGGPGPKVRKGADGDRPEKSRPVRKDPPEGYVASANEGTDGWTVFPEASYRRRRLDQLLSEDRVWDVAAASQVTLDEHDLCAEELMAVWGAWLPSVPEARALTVWAGAQDSVDPATSRRYRQRFHRLHREAARLVLGQVVGHGASHQLLEGLALGMVLQEGIDTLLRGDRPEVLDAAALEDLIQAAWASSTGPGPSDATPTLRFVHALTDGKEPRFLGLSIPEMPAPGGPTSLFQTRRMAFLGHEMVGGPVFRLVMDLGLPGGHYAMAGGASERVLGPGYKAGIDAWRNGDTRPIGGATER